jgi:hypothetical protein
MHTYLPGNLRDEIPKEKGFGPPRAVTPWKKKRSFGMRHIFERVILDMNKNRNAFVFSPDNAYP